MFGAITLATMLAASPVCVAEAPDPNPWKWDDEQIYFATAIIKHAVDNNVDPYALLSLAWVESNIDPTATSTTGDFGMFQVNCRVWWDEMGFDSWNECRLEMFKPMKNIQAASFVFKRYRNQYRACKKSGVFYCYNGGPNWPSSENKERIARYGKRVLNVMWRLKKYYSEWIDDVRDDYTLLTSCDNGDS